MLPYLIELMYNIPHYYHIMITTKKGGETPLPIHFLVVHLIVHFSVNQFLRYSPLYLSSFHITEL